MPGEIWVTFGSLQSVVRRLQQTLLVHNTLMRVQSLTGSCMHKAKIEMPKDEEEPKKKKTPSIKPQDFHAILQTILESYKTLEYKGELPWDLRYKGKLYRLLVVPYILFVKADSVEANKACGLYGSNLEGVKCLCQICCIPADQTDQPYIEPEPQRKTQDMILDLVKQGTKQSTQN